MESEDRDVDVPDSIKGMTSDSDSDTLFQKNTEKDKSVTEKCHVPKTATREKKICNRNLKKQKVNLKGRDQNLPLRMV